MTDQNPKDLAGLLQAVCVARSDVENARRLKWSPGPSTVAIEQRLLWGALERYAAALTQQGRPLPYRMRDEVAIYRAMFSACGER
jgi:hypothetical protein